MPRPYCEKCHFPRRTCICSLVSAVDDVTYDGEIHVLQHPDEVGHAKNSLKLVTQLMPNVQVWTGENQEDFSELAYQVTQSSGGWGCFYPCTSSIENTAFKPDLPDTRLIFIDATWRKARKIWHLNSWMHNLPLYHLSRDYTPQYHIRKNHASHQLSTLEAIAYAIHWETDSTPLLQLFDKFQKQSKKFFS